MHLYGIEQTHSTLAIAELESFGLCTFRGNTALSAEKLSCETAAFIKWRAHVLWHGLPEETIQAAANIKWRAIIKRSFSCFSLHRARSAIPPGKLGALIREASGYQVKLSNPDIRIFTILLDDESYIAYIDWENREDYAARKNHLLPASHPTALHPKIARAMVNIARDNKILDPFCGSGGILIEALLAGKTAHGIELDPRQAARASANLTSMRLHADITIGDCMETSWPSGAIVTDMPLGKNTRMPAKNIVSAFLERAYQEQRRVVMGCMPDEQFPQDWKVAADCTIRFHKSLTKRIVALTPATQPG